MGFIKYIFATVIGVVVGFITSVIIAVGIVTYLVSSTEGMSSSDKEVKSNSFIVLDFSVEIPETKDEFSLFFGGMGSLTLNDYVEMIKSAKKDKSITGLYLKSSSLPHGWSTLKTLRTALDDFKKSKKPIYAYADYYDEKSYYLASVATQVFLHPQGEFSWDGIGASPTFYQGVFEKLGVKPIVFRVGKFKSAIEPYIQKKMSEANKQQVTLLIDDLWQEIISAISVSREIPEESLNEISETLQVRSADEALESKFVDALKIESDIFETLIIKKDVDKIVKDDFKKLITSEKYFAARNEDDFKGQIFASTKDVEFKKATIATITIDGVIMPGTSSEGTVGSDDVVKKILKAKYSKNVKGVIVRVNSPGGSALASDVIWTELKKLRDVKPVYASFGDVAASGGYYIGVAAEKIFAHENTITGSIGVYSLLFNIEKGATEKLGLTFDRVVTHPFADRGSAVRPMTSQESTYFQEDTNRIYQRFIEVVQLGREFDTFENVDDIAQGRVWSGVQAKEVGLIDEFGTLEDTVASLAAQLKLPKDFDVKEIPNEYEFEYILRGLMSWSKFAGINISSPELVFLKNMFQPKFKLSEGVWSLSPNLMIE